MDDPTITQLIPVLQTAIGPTILISGVGLLLLSMTNRLGRAIDQSRLLASGLENAPAARKTEIRAQLQILWSRARLIRLAIALASTSALASAILIMVLFFAALWEMSAVWMIESLFVISMVCLIGSLIVFIHDINRCLAALKLEMSACRIDEE